MSKSVIRSLRWDRVAIIIIVLIGCSSGMVALVTSPGEISKKALKLSHPEPLHKVKGYTIPVKSLAIATKSKSDAFSEALEKAKIEGVNPSGNVKLGSLLPCSCCKQTIKVPKNPYTRHQKAARSLPNSFFIKTDRDLSYGLSVSKLIEIHDGRGYRIDKLRYSSPMLLPEVGDLLEEMGHEYADALKGTNSEGTVFRVTSMTRTDSQQRKLSRRNRSATKSESTHSYGASFDIAFMDRPNENGNCSRPTREIQKLLLRYQDAGRILIIPERGCMHITLIR